MTRDYPSLTSAEALEEIAAGALLLTANNRLARELRAGYDALRRRRGEEVWERGAILPWGAWLQNRHQELLELGLTDQTLLSPWQARVFWEEVIKGSNAEEYEAVLRPGAVARSAEEAWHLLQDWMIPREQLNDWATPETERFLSWADRYLEGCRRKGWMDPARLTALLVEQFKSRRLGIPERLLLAGFDERTPRQEHLLALLEEGGCRIAVVAQDGVAREAYRIRLHDPAQELETAARWAAHRLQSHPNVRIGVIIPRLTELRQQVLHTLEQVFYPAANLLQGPPSAPVYNLSLGKPLGRYPVIADALLLLDLARGELACADVGRLLRSPFLVGGAEEWSRRARLDARIREQVGERHVALDTLLRKLRQAEERERDACPLLLQALERFRTQLQGMHGTAEPAEWAEGFLALLQAAGWPDTAVLNSEQYQQVQRFRELLTDFGSLAVVQPSMTQGEALRRLRSQTEETLFQAEGADAPVQVMGVLEAAGFSFDHLWVVGLTDDQWPSAASPNPLLPQGLQRKLAIPHASADRELAFASLMTERLLASAPEVLVSHASRNEDRPLRPSPLIAGLPVLEPADLGLAGGLDPYQRQAAELEEFIDDQGPALGAGSRIGGGTWIFSDQAQCPFRAFALHRLGAHSIEEPVSGLDGRERGSLLHSVMEAVWSRLRDRATLVTTPREALEKLIGASVDRAIASISHRKPVTFAPRFTELEGERLTGLVLQWLELEKQRADFTVEELEKRSTMTVGELLLDTRADRVDRLVDGGLVIIDYKTGSASCSGWFEERLEEPQLPLYATAVGEGKVSAVFLARLRRGESGFVGVAAEGGIVPKVRAFAETRQSQGYEGCEALFRQWRDSLEMLAAEIRAGRADVDPKDPAKSCRYCPLPSLCRVHERQETVRPSPEGEE
jgi:probable DNA repair protein